MVSKPEHPLSNSRCCKLLENLRHKVKANLWVRFLRQVALIVDKALGEENKSAGHAYSTVLQTLLSVQGNSKLISGDGREKGEGAGRKEKEAH